MISKNLNLVALLALLASGPLSYAATLSDVATRDIDTGGVVALPLDGINITSPDGKRAWFVNESAVVTWTSTIPSNRFWLILSIKNSINSLRVGPVLAGAGSSSCSVIANLPPGEYVAELVPVYDFFKGIHWQSPTFITIERPGNNN